MAVCAHELTHTWLGENLKPERKAAIDPTALEGFCELVAYKYMESRQESFEMEVIRSNDYTKGQITVMLEAERIFGFNAVVDWMKAGEDAKLESSDLDRIRSVKANLITTRPTGSSSAGLVVVPAPPPTPVPETLVLKGISGTPQRRFALINDRTFEPMERGRVRFGHTNIWVRCLEIRDHSVIIQAEGSNERKELVLRAQ